MASRVNTTRDHSEKEERDPVEILAEEFLELHREGRPVDVSEYIQRYPNRAEEIAEVFPAMLALEGAKPESSLAPQLDSFDAVARGKITRLGDFRIVRKIAQGGMGIVYEAEEVSLDRKVAIKILAPHLIADQSALKRFQREAKTIARLHHTNIVSVFGAGIENDLYYFVMEYIDGKSLDRVIKNEEFKGLHANDWGWIAEVAKRIALALRHAHQKNILHRDVKPGNILIDSDNKPWITDFGLAKFEGHDDLTRPGDAVGTLRYMSPEQMEGKSDERTDVFGLGLVLYELLTGEKVYGDSITQNLLERIRNRDLPSPSRINPQIPIDLERITLKAIAIDPADRYQQAEEFAEDLDRWQNDLPVSARQLTTFETCRRWTKRNPLIAGLSAVVTCLLLVLLVSFGSLASAWLSEKSAKLDAKLAQNTADEARKDAESSAAKAIIVLDQLTDDLGVFNLVDDPNPANQSFLFSPKGGIPVSRKNEAQLDLILEFYHSIGQWSDQRDEIRYRRLRANIRSGEISLHLRDYETAKDDLSKVIEELRNESQSKKLLRLRLYANYLMGFANLLSRNYEEADSIFDKQARLIRSLDWDPAELQVERGKLYLGKGILAHYGGNVKQWYSSIVKAIKELEKGVDVQNPVAHPVAAVFLARCYLNMPPKFEKENHQQFYFQCRRKAVAILHRLNRWHVDRAKNRGELSSLVFFFDYCEAISSLPVEVSEVRLANNKVVQTSSLLREAIASCQKIVDSNDDVPAFRFELAKCQFNLARRNADEFERWSQEATNNLKWLTTNYSNDPNFLTASGETRYRIGLYHLAARDLMKAKTEFQKAVNDLDRSLNSSASFPKTQMVFPKVHHQLALVFDELNEPRKAAYHRSQKNMLEKSFPNYRSGGNNR